MKEVFFRGSHFEIGMQHGLSYRQLIQEFVNDDMARVNKLRRAAIVEQNISEYVSPYGAIIKKFLPDLFEEIEGIALGAAISLEKAILLQIRREIIGTNSFTLTGDCSSFGFYKNGNITIGQNIDLNGDMVGLGDVFRIEHNNKPKILQYSFAGLLGYMGMNEYGVAVVINLVVSDNWGIGVPPYLLVRKFLECRDIEECVEIVKGLPIASSRSFIISDKNRVICLEMTTADFRVIEGDFLVHTNHYLHEDFKKMDKLNIFSKNSSLKRKAILEEYLINNNDIDSIKLILKDHSLYPVGICAHNEGNIRYNETVASVIMLPTGRRMIALKGNPCEGVYNDFIF